MQKKVEMATACKYDLCNMYIVPTKYPDGMWYSYIHAHAEYNEKLTNRGPATTVQPDIMVILYRVYPMLLLVLWLLLNS